MISQLSGLSVAWMHPLHLPSLSRAHPWALALHGTKVQQLFLYPRVPQPASLSTFLAATPTKTQLGAFSLLVLTTLSLSSLPFLASLSALPGSQSVVRCSHFLACSLSFPVVLFTLAKSELKSSVLLNLCCAACLCAAECCLVRLNLTHLPRDLPADQHSLLSLAIPPDTRVPLLLSRLPRLLSRVHL